jgi:hypothetical protein
MEKGVIKLVIFNDEDFELETCHLGDYTEDVCDPRDARQRDTW